MGYRDSWLKHTGAVSRHCEVLLHALDRELVSRPIRLLDIGVENGGSLEVWQEVLPEGSEVLGIDIDPACASLGLPVLTGDITDRAWVTDALRGQWFDLIIDSTGLLSPFSWPFLTPGGRLIFEGYPMPPILELIEGAVTSKDTWLPYEEIMRVTTYPEVAVVEKRNPRVVPYLNIMVGNFADVVPESALIQAGVKRVLVD